MEGEYFVKFSKVGYVSKLNFFNVQNGGSICVLDAFSGFSFEDGIIPEGFDFSGNLPWAVDTEKPMMVKINEVWCICIINHQQ